MTPRSRPQGFVSRERVPQPKGSARRIVAFIEQFLVLEVAADALDRSLGGSCIPRYLDFSDRVRPVGEKPATAIQTAIDTMLHLSSLFSAQNPVSPTTLARSAPAGTVAHRLLVASPAPISPAPERDR